MFFALSLTGFLFACWAPGYIAIVILGLHSRLPPLAGPFAISLILNNLLVEVLVLAGLYRQPVFAPLAALILAVAAALLLLDERLSRQNLGRNFAAAKAALSDFTGNRVGAPIAGTCVALLMIFVAAGVVWAAYANMGGAILGYDSIVSWNRWARDWAAGTFPRYIWHYPQLVPVLWSIPYVVAGNNDIQFFSSSFKILFWLMSFETLGFVACRRRDGFLLLSIPVLYFLFHFWLGPTGLEDYADVPVAFFALLSIAVPLANAQTAQDAKTIGLALLFASGAAMTKQVGLYMLAAAPVLVVIWHYKTDRSAAHAFGAAMRLVPFVLLAGLAAAPMYLYAIITIWEGTNASELSYILNDIFGGLTYFQRVILAFHHLFGGGMPRKIACLVIMLAALASLRDGTFRWILLVISIPFLLLWALNFSYDNRNLALAMPFWALCTASGFSTLLRLHAIAGFVPDALERDPASQTATLHVLPALLVMIVAGLAWQKSVQMSASALLSRQYGVERALQSGDPQCTEKMISVLKTFKPSHMTLSEWRWACTFHFNNSPNVCARIFPDQFDFSRKSLSQYAHTDLLIILTTSAATPQRRLQLQSAGLNSVGYAMCDQPSEFFVRRANDKD